MQKYLLLVFVGGVVITCLGCTTPISTLQIVNMRSDSIMKISWNGIEFGDQFIFDSTLWKWGWGLEHGNGETLEVEPGSAPVIFRSTRTDEVYETVEIVKVGEGENVKFTINDSTSVTKKGLTTTFSVRDISTL